MQYARMEKSFPLFDGSVKFSAGQQNVFLVRNLFLNKAIDAAENYKNIYKKYEKLDNFCKTGYEDGLTIITEMANFAVQNLLQEGYYNVDLDSFITKYYAPYVTVWDEACADVIEKYLDLLENKGQAHTIREIRKQSRARFEGGGFGSTVGGTVKGLATGMAIAGVGNLATGAAHSTANFFGDIKTSVQVNKKAKTIYRNSYNMLEDALFISLTKVTDAYMDFLQANSNIEFELAPYEQRKEVQTILKNIVSINIDETKFKTIIMELVQKNPFNAEIYYEICKRMPNEYDRVTALTDFIGITPEVSIIRERLFIENVNSIIEKADNYNILSTPLNEIARIGEQEFIDLVVIKDMQELFLRARWEKISKEDFLQAVEERNNIIEVADKYHLLSNREFLDEPILRLIEDKVAIILSETGNDLEQSLLQSERYFAENFPKNKDLQSKFVAELVFQWEKTIVVDSIMNVLLTKKVLSQVETTLKQYQISIDSSLKQLENKESELVKEFIDNSVSLRENLRVKSINTNIKLIKENIENIKVWLGENITPANSLLLVKELEQLELLLPKVIDTKKAAEKELKQQQLDKLQVSEGEYVKFRMGKLRWFCLATALLFTWSSYEAYMPYQCGDFVLMLVILVLPFSLPTILAVKRYMKAKRYYQILISDGEYSISNLARTVQKSETAVLKEIITLCNKGNFVNMQLSADQSKVVFLF